MNLNKTPQAPDAHAIQRAKERLGADFNKSDLSNIAEIIKAGKAVLLGSCKVRGTQIYLVKYQGRVMKALFDPEICVIISFFGDDFKMGRSSGETKYGGKKPRRNKYRGNLGKRQREKNRGNN